MPYKWNAEEDNILKTYWPGPDGLSMDDIIIKLAEVGCTNLEKKRINARTETLGIKRDPARTKQLRDVSLREFNAKPKEHKEKVIKAGEWPKDAPRFTDFKFKPLNRPVRLIGDVVHGLRSAIS